MTGPAIFFDRDGVLNDIVWREGKPASPRNRDELVLADNAEGLLDGLKSQGFSLFVVTNQPDVSRGKMSPEALDEIHNRLRVELPLDDIAVCTHDNHDECLCRKPKPGLVLGLAERFGVDLSTAWLIGDQDRDVACAHAAGVKSILLARPYNSAAGANYVVSTLSEAVSVITTQTRPSSGVQSL